MDDNIIIHAAPRWPGGAVDNTHLTQKQKICGPRGADLLPARRPPPRTFLSFLMWSGSAAEEELLGLSNVLTQMSLVPELTVMVRLNVWLPSPQEGLTLNKRYSF